MKKEEKEAKAIFSRYVRLRDCLLTTCTPDRGKCFTCGNIFTFEELQCGHFVGGRRNSVFFEINNSHAQCGGCNTFLGGNLDIYREKMIKVYGIDEVERLESLRHQVRKIYSSEFKEIKGEFKSEFNLILSE